MLKLLTPTNILADTQTKCGEIYYQNLKDFTIICSICQMKFFHFDDFLQHIHNVHIDLNDLNQTIAATDTRELEEYLQVNATNEVELCESEDMLDNCIEIDYLQENIENEAETEDLLEDSMEETLDNSELYTESSSGEEKLLISKKSRKKRDIKKTICNSENQDMNNAINVYEFEIQQHFMPSQHEDENSVSKSEKTSKQLEFSCPECQEIFFRKKDMDNHVTEIHNGYKCSLCETRFRYRNHLQRHELKHNPEYKFSCPIEGCNKIYNDHDNFKRHILKHNPEQYFPCPIPECNKIYSISRHLERHIAKHNKSNAVFKRFVCDICGYSCSSTAVLTVHQRRHTGEKPFLCEFCEKGFVSKTALTTHMGMHSNTRPYVCEICDATFVYQRILQRHMLIHSDEKTFKCQFCDKAFKQPQGLDGHMRRLHKDPKAKTDEKLPFLLS